MLIAAREIITGSGRGGGSLAVLRPGYVECCDGVITAVGRGRPPMAPDVSIGDGVLTPGFVDLQVNGYFGVEAATADAAGWERVTAGLPRTGTTAFLPTIITSPLAGTIAALRRIRRHTAGPRSRPDDGARVLGIHLEGPFIARDRRGAHNPDWITDPDPVAVRSLLDAGEGLVRVVTLAPELPGAMAVIGQLTKAGVLVSVGHTDATARQVAQAADHGASMVTHLFNAQRPLHHREPGVVGQALSDTRYVATLIADLHHVSGQAAAIAFAAAPGRICLISDATACAGMPPGHYLLGGEPIELGSRPGEPPVRPDGTLAGSALRMDQAVANMVASGVGLPEAVSAATFVPANLIGRADLGRIAVGARADFACLDGDLRTAATWIGGRPAFGDVPG